MAGAAATEEEIKPKETAGPTPPPIEETEVGPKSITELSPEIQRSLTLISTDPNKSFKIDFHSYHVDNGTSGLPIEERNQIEKQIIAGHYLEYLHLCGGEKCPDDARQLLDDALIEALEARGKIIDGPIELGEIAKLAAGPRQDNILTILAEGELKEQLSSLFDENGYLYSKEALTLERAARALGIGSGITPEQLSESFASYEEFQNWLSGKVDNVARVFNGVIQAIPGLDITERNEARDVIFQGLGNACQVIDKIGKAALEGKEAKPDTDKDTEKEKDKAEDKKEEDTEEKHSPKELKNALNILNKRPKNIKNPTFGKGFLTGLLGTCATYGYYLAAIAPNISTAAVLATQIPWLVGALAVGVAAAGAYYGISKLVRMSRLAYNHRLEQDQAEAKKVIDAYNKSKEEKKA